MKSRLINLKTDESLTRSTNRDLKQWLELSKGTFIGQGYNYEFVDVTENQIKIEISKPSLEAATNLPNDLKNKTKAILNLKNNKYKCGRLSIAASLYPVDKNGRSERKYESQLINEYCIVKKIMNI